MSTVAIEETGRTIASPTPVNIIVHIERLGPPYDDGWVHFSLNLSAALTGVSVSEPTVRTFLAPWNWTWASLAVLGVNASNKTVQLPATAVEVLVTQAPASAKAFVDALNGE